MINEAQDNTAVKEVDTAPLLAQTYAVGRDVLICPTAVFK